MFRYQSNFVILLLLLTSFALAPTEAGRSLKEKGNVTCVECYSSTTALPEKLSGLTSRSVKMLAKLFAVHPKGGRMLIQDYPSPSPGVGHFGGSG